MEVNDTARTRPGHGTILRWISGVKSATGFGAGPAVPGNNEARYFNHRSRWTDETHTWLIPENPSNLGHMKRHVSEATHRDRKRQVRNHTKRHTRGKSHKVLTTWPTPSFRIARLHSHKAWGHLQPYFGLGPRVIALKMFWFGLDLNEHSKTSARWRTSHVSKLTGCVALPLLAPPPYPLGYSRPKALLSWQGSRLMEARVSRKASASAALGHVTYSLKWNMQTTYSGTRSREIPA